MIYADTMYFNYMKKIREILVKVGFTKLQAVTLSVLFVGTGAEGLKRLEENIEKILGEKE